LNRKISSFIIATVLTVALTSSFIPNAFASTELKWDDGGDNGATWNSNGEFLANKFSLPSGWTEARILKARYYMQSQSYLAAFKVHIFDSDLSTELLLPAPTVNPTATGWFDVDLTSYNVIVTGDFYVAIEYLNDTSPRLGWDLDDPDHNQSYYTLTGSWLVYPDVDYMIRVVIDQISPVGGFTMPVNKIEILTPFIALAGLIAVSTVYVIKKRKD
jgi:hypothetical protein